MHSESAELERTHRDPTPALHSLVPKSHSMTRSIVQMCHNGVQGKKKKPKKLFHLKPA